MFSPVCFFWLLCYSIQGRAPSECLVELNLFRSVACSGMLGRADVSKDSSAFISKVERSGHRTVDPEDRDTTIFGNVCNCLALYS